MGDNNNTEVSVLFSEPKISQSTTPPASADTAAVSVLFSEPKISQSAAPASDAEHDPSFSALQRAENFSIVDVPDQNDRRDEFQCSSASRKFLNSSGASPKMRRSSVSVLFSEPKISQSGRNLPAVLRHGVSVLFSEPKISQSVYAALDDAATQGFSALQRAENFSISTAWPGTTI